MATTAIVVPISFMNSSIKSYPEDNNIIIFFNRRETCKINQSIKFENCDDHESYLLDGILSGDKIRIVIFLFI